MLQQMYSRHGVEGPQATNGRIEHVLQGEHYLASASHCGQIDRELKSVRTSIAAHDRGIRCMFSHEHRQEAKATSYIEKAPTYEEVKNTPIDCCKRGYIGNSWRWSERMSHLLTHLRKSIEAKALPDRWLMAWWRKWRSKYSKKCRTKFL